MRPPARTKYIYKIRSRNGSVVENLQIYGKDAEDARRKLHQMYMHCEILEENILQPMNSGNSSFESVIDIIVGDDKK